MSFKNFLTKTIIVSGFVLLSSVSVFGASKGAVLGDNVNLRSSADTAADVLKTLTNGTEVTVSAKENEWYVIDCVSGEKGYIFKDFLEITEAEGKAIDNNVNVRESADTASTVVGIINMNDAVIVTGHNNNWYQVRCVSGLTAYIYKDFISGDLIDETKEMSETLINTYAIITSDSGLNLRAEPSTDGAVVEVLKKNDVVDVIEGGQYWVKVSTTTNAVGYLSTEFLAIREGGNPSRGNSDLAAQIISYGKQFLGTPYSWGGTNLNSGVDCSGFVYSVMKHFGITLNRSSYEMVNNGVAVEKDYLQMGDIVLFDTTGVNDGGISHVGIYIGNGDFIHSSSSSRTWGVVISNLFNEPYYVRTYVTARRVIR